MLSMKRLATLLLTLVGLSAFAGTAAAQFAPVPKITSVPQRKSYAPANVAILGSNLGLATDVKVNGVSYPVVRRTATRLVVGPVAPQDPGFGLVEVFSTSSVATAPISLVPTLTGTRRRTRVDLVLNNGDTGTYVLRYSYSVLGAPAVDQSVYGPRFLGLNAPALAVGVFADASPLALSTLLPVQIGQIGADLRLQAQCSADTAGLDAYTNLVTVPGFNANPHP
jgi:hypothetical protein